MFTRVCKVIFIKTSFHIIVWLETNQLKLKSFRPLINNCVERFGKVFEITFNFLKSKKRASEKAVNLSIMMLLLVHATYIWVLFFAHIPVVVNCTFNTMAMERLQQHPLLFTMNRTDCTFFLWRLHLAQPSHPGHSTTLLRSESPSNKCEKLYTVATSNNRDDLTRSLVITIRKYSQLFTRFTSIVTGHSPNHSIGITPLLLVHTTYLYGCCS